MNQDRRVQHDTQLYNYIKNFLTAEVEHKILAKREVYHINEQPSCPLLFKLLMQKVIIDNWSNSSLMQENESNLDLYMATVKLDIEEFNRYMKLNYQGL